MGVTPGPYTNSVDAPVDDVEGEYDELVDELDGDYYGFLVGDGAVEFE